MTVIKLIIPGSERTVIVMPASCAALCAELMSKGVLYEKEGWSDPSQWKRADKGILIEFVDDGEFAPPDARVTEANKRAEQKQSEWAAEYTKANALKKERDELKAQLEALMKVTVCNQVAPDVLSDDRGEPVDFQ